MKNNNINFTGIRNLGSVKIQRQGCKITKNLSMTLHNDCKGKDLQEFQNVLKWINVNSSLYKNKNHPNLLNLECLDTQNGQKYIAINGTILEEKNETIPMFSYLAKLTRKISKMPEKDMVVNNDYKNIAGKETLVSNDKIPDYDKLVKNGAVEQFFETDWVKDASNKINKFINDIMFEYLGIK